MNAIIFCGLQGSGKSTFYSRRFAETHVRLSMDMPRTRIRVRIDGGDFRVEELS